MKNEFDVNDLKTGMRVTFDLYPGNPLTVLKGVASGYHKVEDILVGSKEGSHTWCRIVQEDLEYMGTIIKVEVPEHPYDIFYDFNGHNTIYERKVESEQQKKIRELEETINKAKAQIENLKKEVS